MALSGNVFATSVVGVQLRVGQIVHGRDPGRVISAIYAPAFVGATGSEIPTLVSAK